MATTTTKYQQLQQLMNRHLQSGTKTKSEFANFNLKVYLMCACIFWLGYRFSWLVCDLFLYGFGLYGAHIYIFISLLFIKIKRFYLLCFFFQNLFINEFIRRKTRNEESEKRYETNYGSNNRVILFLCNCYKYLPLIWIA